jgi:hypothetical protein
VSSRPGGLIRKLQRVDNVWIDSFVANISSLIPPGAVFPNGAAVDVVNQRLYITSQTSLFFLDLRTLTTTLAGTLTGVGRATNGDLFQGSFYYIAHDSDDLFQVRIDAVTGLVISETKIADVTGNRAAFGFGDIAIRPDGLIFLVWGNSTTKEVAAYSLATRTFTSILANAPSRMALYGQIAFSNGVLYNHDSALGVLYELNQTTASLRLANFTTAPFSDIAGSVECPDVVQLFGVPDGVCTNCGFEAIGAGNLPPSWTLSDNLPVSDVAGLGVQPSGAGGVTTQNGERYLNGGSSSRFSQRVVVNAAGGVTYTASVVAIQVAGPPASAQLMLSSFSNGSSPLASVQVTVTSSWRFMTVSFTAPATFVGPLFVHLVSSGGTSGTSAVGWDTVRVSAAYSRVVNGNFQQPLAIGWTRINYPGSVAGFTGGLVASTTRVGMVHVGSSLSPFSSP